MPDVEAAGITEVRKRGRPRKTPAPEPGEPAVKRGRGRPKGSKSPKKKDASKDTGPKRPRGRPKGSVKKKPIEEAEPNDNSAIPQKSPKK